MISFIVIAFIDFQGVYKAFSSTARTTNPFTLPVLSFMTNCIVELFDLDVMCAYQNCFTAIRQLAIHLRNAITQQSQETTKVLYNWPIIHALRLWCRVLGNQCQQSRMTQKQDKKNVAVMSELIYPLVQVTLGTANFITSQRYMPLRLHLIRALVELIGQTGVFIPLAAHCMDMLNTLVQISDSSRPASLKPLNIQLNYLVPKNYLNTRILVDTMVEHSCETLLAFLAYTSTSIGFPESAIPIIAALKKIKKTTKNIKFSKQVGALVDKTVQTREMMMRRRADVDFAPVALEKATEWSDAIRMQETPLGQYWEQAKKIRQQKRRLAQQ
jgi:nucleolar complex protein 2